MKSVLSFAEYTELKEGNYPAWVKITVGAMVLKVRNLSTRIQGETDPVKQNRLIAQQNKLLAYVGDKLHELYERSRYVSDIRCEQGICRIWYGCQR